MRISSKDLAARRDAAGGAGPVVEAPRAGFAPCAIPAPAVPVVAVVDAAGLDVDAASPVLAPKRLGVGVGSLDLAPKRPGVVVVSAGFVPKRLGVAAGAELVAEVVGAVEDDELSWLLPGENRLVAGVAEDAAGETAGLA